MIVITFPRLKIQYFFYNKPENIFRQVFWGANQ